MNGLRDETPTHKHKTEKQRRVLNVPAKKKKKIKEEKNAKKIRHCWQTGDTYVSTSEIV